MATEEKKWHALYVASRQEKAVFKALSEKSIDAYLPLIKTLRQWSDRKKMVELPLMNGYIFVNIRETEKDRVLQVKGIVNFVRSDGKIAVIRDQEIDSLKQFITLGYQIEARAKTADHKEGDRIKITSGALRGVEGVVTVSKEGRFIEVLLESIGQCIRVKLPKEILIPA
ncbi:MAG: UpxY family transcription antiterminator [Bacteroidia bacterium]